MSGGMVDSVGEAGGDIATVGGIAPITAKQRCPGVQDSNVSAPPAASMRELRGDEIMSGQARHDGRRRASSREPGRHRRIGRRLAGRSLDRIKYYFT